MRLNCFGIAFVYALVFATPVQPVAAADLVWEVVNPFRFYKDASAFRLHEDAFKAITAGGTANDPQAIRKIERCLNDPKTMAGTTRAACEALVKEHRVDARLGWAASTLASTCYDHLNVRPPRRFPVKCEREQAGSRVAEDYILPDSHTVRIGLSPERNMEAGSGTCVWSVKPRAGGEWTRFDAQPCADRKVVEAPFSKDRALSGLDVKVEAPGNRTFTEDVIVEDLLIAALGDSFASGEGNPDKPVTFSSVRGLNYRHECNVATANIFGKGLLSLADRDPFILPRRLMRDEQQGGRQFDYCGDDFLKAFWERSAQWLSPDCHRSQYAFPMRVSLQLALEDRHRAVTLVHLACSGALVTEGMFKSLGAREHHDPSPNKAKTVAPQFDQLTQLICRDGSRVRSPNYPVVAFKTGETQPIPENLFTQVCPAAKRKRDIDLVLLSIGGNDVGFSALAGYTFLDSARDIAKIAGVMEGQFRFGPSVADVYLGTLHARLSAVQKALGVGFGVKPSRVVHVSYENVEYDEEGKLCALNGRDTIGMDVHKKFKFNLGRVREVNKFLTRLFDGLQCASDGQKCPAGRPSREGTNFTLVADHQPEFMMRGICARDPLNAAADERLMTMPRVVAGGLSPWTPSTYRPYAHRARLFRTPNDAFLTANEHRGHETKLFDILQPAVAALFSGAFHPTAEAHAIVADHVVVHARRALTQP